MQTSTVVLIGQVLSFFIIAWFVYQFLTLPTNECSDFFVLGYVKDEKQQIASKKQESTDSVLVNDCKQLLRKLGFNSSESNSIVKKAFSTYQIENVEEFIKIIPKVS